VLVGIAEYEGAIEAAIDTGLRLLENARENLAPLEPTECSAALDGITRYVGYLLENCRR